MKLVSAAQMRELDRRTIEEAGVPGEVLMDRAGTGVADVVRRLAEVSGVDDAPVLLLAGRGNNGGDAFTAAYHLTEMGYTVDVWLTAEAREVKGDALKHLNRMTAAGIIPRELPARADWEDAAVEAGYYSVLVDGLLGTGGSGPPRGPAANAISFINERSSESLVVAIDIPSGLDADTGEVAGEAVVADATVTMGMPKRGLVAHAALPYVGRLEVVDIGVPDEYVEEAELDADRELICPHELCTLFRRRERISHKGDYGRVLLVGGARGYTGAMAMAARTAVRSGAGLVTVVVPESLVPIVASAAPEAMVTGAPETAEGSLSADLWPAWQERLDDFDAVLVGPGMTRHEHTRILVHHLLDACAVPLVVDADAISVFAGEAEEFGAANGPVVLTPHPGELARLLGQDVEGIQVDRFAAAALAVRFTGATVVLKGAGTLVAEEGRPTSINMTGNPGMATGGSGDVLAGLLAGLLGQGLLPYDAAKAAVYLHGRAGDLAAWMKCQAGLAAGDLIEEVPYVLRELTFR